VRDRKASEGAHGASGKKKKRENDGGPRNRKWHPKGGGVVGGGGAISAWEENGSSLNHEKEVGGRAKVENGQVKQKKKYAIKEEKSFHIE